MRARHARERNLEREPRVARPAHLRSELAEQVEHACEAVRSAELGGLGLQHRKLLGGAIDHAGRIAHGSDHEQVAHVAGELAHELRKVGSGLCGGCDPAEASRDVAAGDEPRDLEQLRRVDLAEQPLDVIDGDLAAGERRQLLERGDRIAHSAVGMTRDKREGSAVDAGSPRTRR